MPSPSRPGSSALPTLPTLPASGQAEADDALDLADSSDSSDTADTAEEKSRSGIQSIEVGFRLLDVLTNEPRAMMLRETLQDILAGEDPEALRWWVTRARRSRCHRR